MSSTTAGQVYSLFADPANAFVPYVPSGTLSAAVGSGSAFTQTTAADVTLVNVMLRGGSLGPFGRLRVSGLTSISSGSATMRRCALRIDALDIVRMSNNVSTSNCLGTNGKVLPNRGFEQRQVYGDPALLIDSGYAGAAPSSQFINTAIDKPVTAIANMITATDSVVLEHFLFEVIPS